jgi:hypothetical protein
MMRGVVEYNPAARAKPPRLIRESSHTAVFEEAEIAAFLDSISPNLLKERPINCQPPQRNGQVHNQYPPSSPSGINIALPALPGGGGTRWSKMFLVKEEL